MKIASSTFLIAGGASGLGAACVRHLVGRGANVVVVDLDDSTGTALVAELGAKARFAQADVADEAGVRSAVELAVATFGSLQGAVNCAGVELAKKVLGRSGLHPLDAFERTVRVNLVGTFNVVRLAAEAIVKAPAGPDGERGVIVNTASVAAFDGQVGQAAYAASKGAIAAMTLPLARELAAHGIRVLAIAPGVFDTPLLARLPGPVRASLERLTPFPHRLGKPEEFAELVGHMIENPMLNGEVVRLDGSLRMPAQ